MIPIHTVLPLAGSEKVQIVGSAIMCPGCGAVCAATSKRRGRFLKRHPAKCQERREFSRQLAEGVRSVEDPTFAVDTADLWDKENNG